jgi:hypothetical protein
MSRQEQALEMARAAGLTILGHRLTTDRMGVPLVIVRGTREGSLTTAFLIVVFREDGSVQEIEATRSEARWVARNSVDELAAHRQESMFKRDRGRYGYAPAHPRLRHEQANVMLSGVDPVTGRYTCPWCGARQISHRSGRREYACGTWVDRILGTREQSEGCKVHEANREVGREKRRAGGAS